MADVHAIVAIYRIQTEAEEAAQALQSAGFSPRQVSLVGRDHLTEEDVVGYCNAGGQKKSIGTLGASWSRVSRNFVGTAFLWVPGMGPIVVAGPLVSWMVSTLDEPKKRGALSAVGAALSRVGIPRHSALSYESAVRANKFLLVVHGTEDEAEEAYDILHRTHPVDITLHHGPVG